SSTRIATIAPLRAKAKCHAVGRTWSAPRGDPKPGLSPVRARPRGQQALPREGSSPDGRDAASAARGAAPPAARGGWPRKEGTRPSGFPLRDMLKKIYFSDAVARGVPGRRGAGRA